MSVLHVRVERGEEWLVAQGLEEPGVITQGKTLDELVRNIEDAYRLLTGQAEVQIELLLPPGLMSMKAAGKRRVKAHR